MNIAHLREFVTLASYLKLTSAARELYMSPSTLSQHLTALEKEVGFELFVRLNNGLGLTPQGEAALEHAQKILFEYNALLGDCSRLSSQRVVQISMPNYHYLKSAIVDAREPFLAEHPDCQVVLNTNEYQNDDPFEIIKDGSSDVSMLFIVRGCGYTIEDKLPEGTAYIPLVPQRCVFVSSANHPLAGKATLTARDLNGATVVLKLCPICSILMDGVTRVLNGHGALVRVLFRKAARNADILLNDLGDTFMQWFESLGDSPDDALPDLPVHRFEHELIADSYLLYRPDRLDDLQRAYLETVGHTVRTSSAT